MYVSIVVVVVVVTGAGQSPYSPYSYVVMVVVVISQFSLSSFGLQCEILFDSGRYQKGELFQCCCCSTARKAH